MPRRVLRTAAAHTAPGAGAQHGAAEPPALAGRSARDVRAPTPYALRLLVGSDSRRRAVRVSALLILDLIGIWLAIWSAVALKEAIQGTFQFGAVSHTAWHYVPFAFLITALLFGRVGLYGAREGRPGLARIVATLFQVAVISLIFALISGDHFSSYWIFYGGLALACAYVGTLRFAYESLTGRLLTAMGFRCRAMLVGNGPRVRAVAHALEDDAPARRYEVVGYLSAEDGEVEGLRNLGRLGELPDRISQHAVEEVIITDPDFPSEAAVELIDECHSSGVRVRVAPSTMSVLTQRAELVPGEGVPLFEVRPPVFEGIDFVMKRAFDVVGASLLLLILSPVLLLIALGVRLTSRGPILHKGLRPGLGGRPFKCLKFRTMGSDAEMRQAEFEALNESSGALFKIRNDPRLTRLGRFLRRNSLDELPQLINVLRGEMSLVGPRPLPLRDHARLEEWHRRRYLVLPGITGLWQVSGRSDLNFDDMVRLDFLYLERWSVLLDLVILARTVPAVIRRRGAY